MKFVECSVSKKGIASVWLNRPEMHNAFDETMIAELTELFKTLGHDNHVRLIVLSSEGRSFCAGADLNWMRRMKGATREENLEDARKLAVMYKTINEVPQPLITKVHGAAVGGGTGLIAVSDYVVAAAGTYIGLSEVRLGLVPAVISPFVIRKMGESNARAWFLSGELFTAERALQMNLIHEVIDGAHLQERVIEISHSFMKAGPLAARYAKKLIADITRPDITEYTVQLLSHVRVSNEGQEGLSALLNKTSPSWIGE